jgi:metal-responsive CopG/Arc/MetJ family transcriptional regulator
MRINAILPDEIIVKLDAIGEEEKKSRSRLLREAAENFIGERRRSVLEKEKRERIGYAIATQDRLKKKSGKWDGVSEVRKWRDMKK